MSVFGLTSCHAMPWHAYHVSAWISQVKWLMSDKVMHYYPTSNCTSNASAMLHNDLTFYGKKHHSSPLPPMCKVTFLTQIDRHHMYKTRLLKTTFLSFCILKTFHGKVVSYPTCNSCAKCFYWFRLCRKAFSKHLTTWAAMKHMALQSCHHTQNATWCLNLRSLTT